MNLGTCEREHEVVDLMKDGHWPQASSPELRAHVANCRSCSETVLVRATFRAALASAKRAAPLDSPNLLWRRAQIRRRYTALETVARPLARAHRFALAVNILAILLLLVSQARRTGGWTAWLAAMHQSPAFHPAALWPTTAFALNGNLQIFILCAAAIALLSVVAICVATEPS